MWNIRESEVIYHWCLETETLDTSDLQHEAFDLQWRGTDGMMRTRRFEPILEGHLCTDYELVGEEWLVVGREPIDDLAIKSL